MFVPVKVAGSMRQVKVTVFAVSAAPAGSDVSSGFGFRSAGGSSGYE